MRISVVDQGQSQIKEILVQTISLKKSLDDPLKTLMFHCPYCSDSISQIQGLVSSISPGLTPTTQVVVINKCKRCGMRYTFQEFQTSNSYARVVLTEYENPEHVFKCYVCRNNLLSFDRYGNYFLEPSLKRVQLPVAVICPNIRCQADYYVTDLV